MRVQEIDIKVSGSMPDAKMTAYILDTPKDRDLLITKRPLLILCPGGGYEKISYREGEPLAMHFLNKGYHACVLAYSVAPATFPTQVMELGEAMKAVRAHAEEWNVDTDHIFIQGSSAGGHLAASYGIYWDQEFLSGQVGMKPADLRPSGLILSYPVITTDPRYWHKGTFVNLLGDKFDTCLETQSLENQVRPSMPPCFLWHTAEDETVPVENSILMALALRRVHVPVELHIFPKGEHGLSLASPLVERADGSGVNEACEPWISLADTWISQILCGSINGVNDGRNEK